MINKNASPEMRTATYDVDAASGRCRRQNVPRHILCYVTNNKSHEGIPPPTSSGARALRRKKRRRDMAKEKMVKNIT